MKFRSKSFFFTIFLLFSVFKCGNAQNNAVKIDSLYGLYSKEHIDTSKVNLLIQLSEAYQNSNRVKGISFSREALELAERIKYYKGITLAASQIADYYYDQLNYPESIKIYLKAAHAAEEGDLPILLQNIYNAMGIIYSNQKRNDQALRYFLKVAKIAEQHKLKKRLAVAYNNIGIAYKNLGRFSEAVSYYKKALAQFEESKYLSGIASASNNLGTVAHAMHNDEEALRYYQISIDNFHALNDTASEAGIYTNIGELYNDKKEYQKALGFYLKGVAVAEKYKISIFRDDAYEGLAKVYANLKNYEKAYYYKNRYLALKDSMNNEEGMRQVQEMEKRLENEKAEKEIEILTQREEIQNLKVRSQSEKLKQSSIIIYSVAGILLIVLLMSFFLFKALRQIRKTNVELAEKKKEIQDSINYASNIQQAMLPEVSVMNAHFPEGFGLYLPKDVVSGDFYWFNELNGNVYFAVADCTGHGVPGAFMSMIGIDKLNQSLIDKKIENLSDILSALNKSIKQALKQKDDSAITKDGMDIALCSYNKERKQLRFAGANRPLWILREKNIIEYKATKASIAGFTDLAQVYESQYIQLKAGDVIYIFTDGFADQFGGENRKKFMTKQLKQVLIEIHQLPMYEQETKLHAIFNNWKGKLEQVDDVLLLGFRV